MTFKSVISSCRGLAEGVLLMFVAFPNAYAVDKSLIGGWTTNGRKCDFHDHGRFRITSKGLSGYEFNCKPTKKERDKGGWKVRLSCSAEDGPNALNLKWRLLPNGRLQEIEGAKVRVFTRCTEN
jgi:hypothetical protein